MISRRLGAIVGAVTALGVAVAFRIPSFLSTHDLGYDDGVYASSVILMREGFDPFRDFFSSQGPFFLPSVRLFDMIGIGGLKAPRSAMVFTGAAIAAGIYLLAAMDHGRSRAALAALLGASSGLLLTAAGPIQSDGIALALGLFALAAAAGDHERHRWLAPLAGTLIGLGLATKSLHLFPLAIVVLVLISLRAQRSALVAAVFSAAAAGVIVTLPWGFEDVWDQYVVFHLSRPRVFNPIGHIGKITQFMLNFELPLIVIILAGTTLKLGRFDPVLTSEPRKRLPVWLVVLWLAMTASSLIFITGVEIGFHRFVGFAIPPLILLAMRTPLPSRLALVFMLLAVPYQWTHLPFMDAIHPAGLEAEMIEAIATIPEDRFVVADQPGMVWSAGRVSHPDTVDISFGMIDSGRVTSQDVTDAAAAERTCAFLAFSSRFLTLGIDQPPPDYGIAIAEGDQYLAFRPGCQ